MAHIVNLSSKSPARKCFRHRPVGDVPDELREFGMRSSSQSSILGESGGIHIDSRHSGSISQKQQGESSFNAVSAPATTNTFVLTLIYSDPMFHFFTAAVWV